MNTKYLMKGDNGALKDSAIKWFQLLLFKE